MERWSEDGVVVARGEREREKVILRETQIDLERERESRGRRTT